MKLRFEKVIIPCVISEVTLWHLQHGLLFDVVDDSSNRRLGVVFWSVFAGDGCVIHFLTCPGVAISPVTFLAGARKFVALAANWANIVLTTVPEEKQKLVSVLLRLGFRIVEGADFWRDDQKILLLKYYKT